jgi:transcription antitermination factor NusG
MMLAKTGNGWCATPGGSEVSGDCGKFAQKDQWDSLGGAMSPTVSQSTSSKKTPLETGELRWFALETRHHCEKRVVQELSKKGIETFLPERTEIRNWSDRRKKTKVPLFAGYAFVLLDRSRDTRLRVLQTAGVMGLVSSHGQAVPVPTDQLEHLRRLLQENLPCSLHAFLRAGQRIRVRGGSLDGIEGILVDSGAKHLVISIACLQRSLAVRIEGYELELA